MTAKATRVPAGETAAAKFVRVIEPRVQRTIAQLELVANGANPQYQPSPEQVQHMLDAIRAKVDEVESKYAKGPRAQGARFTF